MVAAVPRTHPLLRSTAQVTLGNWHHVAFVHDEVARTNTFYIDGVAGVLGLLGSRHRRLR